MNNVILVKEKKFKVFYDSLNTKTIGVENIGNHDIDFYISLKRGFNLRTDNNLTPMTWKTVINRNKEDLYVIIYFNYRIYVYTIEYIDDMPTIKSINKTQDFDYTNPINIFLGHSGGGTSVVVKMLRYLGLHFGDDSGPKENRKAHESSSITTIIKHIDNETPTYVCRDLFNQIWSEYNYKKDKVNCFKKPDIYDKTIKLGEVFPNCKIVSIMRKPNGFFSKTEGKKFNEKSEIDLIQYQRPLVEGTPMFHLDFNKFFTDYNYVNKLLRFLGSDNFLNNEQELEQLKNKINFDNRVLK